MNDTPTLPKVRAVLKGAGLKPANRTVSKQVRGYSSVTSQGFALKRESEYKRVEDKSERRGWRKAHVPTGRIQVDILLSSWHADEAKAADDLATAKRVLTEAGYTVTEHTAASILVG